MISFYEDNHVDYYHATVSIDPSPFLEPLVERLAPGATVLDVGCGAGRDLRWLANRGFKPTGFEISPGLADLARNHSKRPIIEGDFTNYDFSALQFDALLLIGALVHIKHFEFAPVLLDICQALRETGLINISLKEGEGCTHGGDGRVFTLWQQEQLEKLFSEHALEILFSSRFCSALNDQDVWLSYILKKQ